MFIRLTLVFVLALACIFPLLHYAKALDLSDRPVFLRRIEEKLAVFFPRLFDDTEKKNQIDYGHNAAHVPVALQEPPLAIAKKQRKTIDYSAAPSILKQDWSFESIQPAPPETDTQAAAQDTVDTTPVHALPQQQESQEQQEAQDKPSDTRDRQWVQLPGNANLAEPALLEPETTENQASKSDDLADESRLPELSQEEVQALNGTEVPSAPPLNAKPEVIANRRKEVDVSDPSPTEEPDANHHLALNESALTDIEKQAPVIHVMADDPKASAYQPIPLADQNSAGIGASDDNAGAESAHADIQKQLAAQQTLEHIEQYAQQLREAQAEKDQLEQQQLQELHAQIQQQQVVAETKRLRQEQSLWIQAAEDSRQIMERQQQLLEAEVQRLNLIKQAEAEQLALAQQALAEQQAREQQALAEQLAREQQALLDQQEQERKAEELEQLLQAVADEKKALQQQLQEAEQQAREQQAQAEQLALEQQAKEEAQALARAEALKAEQLAREQQALLDQQAQDRKAEELEQLLQAVAEEKKALQQQLQEAEQQARERQAIEQYAQAERLALQQQAQAAEKRALEMQALAQQQAKAEALARAEALKAEQLAREQQAQAEAEALARAEALRAEQLAREQQELAEQLALAERNKLAKMAEQQRLAAIAQHAEELRQTLAQAKAAAQQQVDWIERELSARQMARAQQAQAEQIARTEQLAREQQALTEQQAKAEAETLARAEALKAEQFAREQQALAEQQAKAEAETLARAEALKAEQLAREQQALTEQQAKAEAEALARAEALKAEQFAREQAMAEQSALAERNKLAELAEQQRLAAIAQRAEELRQTLAQAKAAEQEQTDRMGRELSARQLARAQQAQAEQIARTEQLAREQRLLAEQQAKAEALKAEQLAREKQAIAEQLMREEKVRIEKLAQEQALKEMRLAIEQREKQSKEAEQQRLDAIAKTAAENAKATEQASQEAFRQAQLSSQAIEQKQQARALKIEQELIAKTNQIARERQLIAEQQARAEVLAQQALEKKNEENAKRAAETKLAQQSKAEADAKRMADLNKQSDELRQKLATLKKQQQAASASAKESAKALSSQIGEANLSTNEVTFIRENKLNELVASMGTVSQGGAGIDQPQTMPVKPLTASTDMAKEPEMNWTSMPLATDLPPQIAKLGESFIDTVFKQLPSSKKMAKTMPFDEFKLRIKEAIDSSPDMAVVSNLAQQSKASKSLALSSLLPQVTGTSDSGKRTTRNPWYDTTYVQDGSNFGISVSQLVFDFGAGIFGLKAGKARVKAAEELLVSKKSEQALKSINAFIELERARDQYKLAVQNAQSRLELIRLVKERFALGGGTKPDVIRAESRYAEALSSVAMASSKVSSAEANYRELFASSPAGVVVGPDHEFVIEGLNKSAEELAGTYPGLLQLARLKDATSEESKAVIAKTLPSFSLVYSNTSQGHFVANVTPASSTSMVLQMSVPIYNGGADTARKEDAKLKALQSELEFESAMRSFEKVLLQSQAEVKNSEEILTSRSVSVRSAIASMRAVREQFAFNKGTLLDLISVQDSLYQSGKDMIDASADRNLARYRLTHLTSELHKVFQLSDSPLMVRD